MQINVVSLITLKISFITQRKKIQFPTLVKIIKWFAMYTLSPFQLHFLMPFPKHYSVFWGKPLPLFTIKEGKIT